MRLNAAARSRLTTSIFSTTFVIAVFTVAAPSILPCPARESPLGMDSGDTMREAELKMLADARRKRRETFWRALGYDYKDSE
ncbi:hypothetical protein V1514DRAFT_336239 [Lipomyces japonicus]|uniref:uncharacterized protein n=1 Tax=Lipomyces japonicus TaxID=56871 RepID=UPI0034CD4D79